MLYTPKSSGNLTGAYARQGVQAIIMNRRAEMLLLLRDNNPYTVYPKTWSTVGGKVEWGETPEDALAREVPEEIGWEMQDFSLYTLVMNPQRKALNHVFASVVTAGADSIVLKEGRAKRFFSADEMRHLDMPPFVRQFTQVFYAEGHADRMLAESAQFRSRAVLTL